MKILMDADCLIKLTKSGLKEIVARKYKIIIPEIVKNEVVDLGKDKGCHDAVVVEKNIDAGRILVAKTPFKYSSGDQAVIEQFQKEKYDVIATDDTKLIKKLRISNMPFIVPALIIYNLFLKEALNRADALHALETLADYISDDEYSAVKLLMENYNES